MKEILRVGIATISRKNETTAIVRISPRPPNKKQGRFGTRKMWKKIHSPSFIEVYIGNDPLSALVLPGAFGKLLNVQYILSSKHLKPSAI